MAQRIRKTEERFWSRVARRGPDECWEWQGRLDRYGYGKFNAKNSTLVAHRVAYRSTVGPIPDGLQLDHLCRNRTCVNPSHLEPVTLQENIRRGAAFRLADDPMQEIARRQADGWTLVDLAKEFGLTPNAIKFRLQKRGAYVARGSGRRSSPS